MDCSGGWMTKSRVPQRAGRFGDSKALFIEGWLERVESIFTFADMEDFLRLLFLNEKKIRVKF
jgi:hypothetical protein